MASLRPLVAGNWKMNGLKAALPELAAINEAVAKGAAGRAECAVCPPFTLIAAAADLCAGKNSLQVGGQNCHTAASGAFTGDISAEMLKDAGASLVIVGHSERRANHAETDDQVRSKAEAAARAGLMAIICVGETRAERDGGETLRVVGRQIDESVPPKSTGEAIAIAYEPVWAIGTGVTPSNQDVVEVHGFIRRRLAAVLGPEGDKVRILYGGSVKPANARELTGLANVDGVLVGGASLTAKDFLGIAEAYT
ncbi:MAG TPA: triose-phosphate isomerase [Lichenihabitans sp.]|jgi:triosephosphate isomerase|nr:triose-phosphate isomerase [Lichenihabitans sp.]